MMALTIPTHSSLNLPSLQYTPCNTFLQVIRPTRRKPSASSHFHINNKTSNFNPKLCSKSAVLTRASADGGGSGAVDANPQQKASL